MDKHGPRAVWESVSRGRGHLKLGRDFVAREEVGGYAFWVMLCSASHSSAPGGARIPRRPGAHPSKTAKALGLTIPLSLLQRADQVIE